jgi:histone-lysine N-methyltransferase SETMAR
MLTIFWSPLGFSLLEILPKRIHFDSQYFCSSNLSAIVQNRQSETHEDRRRRMVVHFDSATPHTAKYMIDYLKASRLTRASRPAFSPDLAPSDFYLFGKLKMALMGAAFADDELLQGVMEVLNGISREELEEIFEK